MSALTAAKVVIYCKKSGGNIMKKIGTGLFFIFLCTLVFTRDYSKEFMDYFKSDYRSIDYRSMEKLLIDWEKERPDDPEMLIGYFNYYVNRDLEMLPAMGKADDGKYYGAYLQKNFNNDDVIKGISFLDKALVKNPQRLDIYFGKCSTLLQARFYKEGIKAILDLLNTSVKVNNEWLWTNNVPIQEDGEAVLLDGINGYFAILFNNFEYVKDDLGNLAKKLEQLYPNNLISINQTANYYSYSGNNKKAIELLEKGHKLDKNDYIILGNLGYLYEEKKDYKAARTCYEKMLKIDNPQSKQYAKEYLEALDKKDRRTGRSKKD